MTDTAPDSGIIVELTQEQQSKIAEATGLRLSRIRVRPADASGAVVTADFEDNGGFQGGGGSSGGGGASGGW